MIDPQTLLRPRRQITGISAILLPFTDQGDIDWDGLRNHIQRTAEAGITPAVNMDTGYANLITEEQRQAVLRVTREVLGGESFVAGAYVADQPGSPWNEATYSDRIDAIQQVGGIPIIFQSFGLTQQSRVGIVRSYETIAQWTDQFIAFELGQMFAPFGAIYDLQVYAALMGLPQCIGAKHSSLSRQLEWQRLALRDERRPDFKVFTGNDLAIDMVMYGSDYLLGLSTFAPDLFARRDALWLAGDPAFYELNDLLQYLGFFAFRTPVPAYKHSAAQFLKLRGWIASDTPHPAGERRPDSDVAVLADIAGRLTVLTGGQV
ncbi:MAG: dihydrodipicolinate synthase family protein [Anaerolineaceae bacterium]|nr:dihydrodipicolinate synthase family protein [Anaerolineaceae bacterium]